MGLFDAGQINALSKFLDATALRQNLVTTNLANVDTPGYRTKDVDFRSALTSASMGMGMMQADSHPAVHEVEGLMERPDGNNVSLEREGLLLAQTQLQFRTAVDLLRSEFHKISLAINEGK